MKLTNSGKGDIAACASKFYNSLQKILKNSTQNLRHGRIF
jgi:hypothetical protein